MPRPSLSYGLGRGVWWLVRQPMGVGGLAILLYVATLIGLSWWQTRPKPEPQAVSTPELSDAERRIVQDIRTIWKRYGRDAVQQFHTLMYDAVYDLKEREYWGALVMPVVGRLEQSAEHMTQAVAFDTKLTVKEIRERFNDLYAAYLDALKWFAKLEAKGDIVLDEHRVKQLRWWQERHFYFRDKLEDLNQVPEHHGSLKIYLQFIEDDAFGRFLSAAETPPSRDEE